MSAEDDDKRPQGVPFQKNYAQLPTIAEVSDILRRSFKRTALDRKPASEDPTSPPLAIGLFVLGVQSSILHHVIMSSAPWLDREEGSALHLLTLGNPKACSPEFRKYTASLGPSINEDLYGVWSDVARNYESLTIAEAYVNAQAAEDYGLSEDDLPALLVFTFEERHNPLVVRIPHDLAQELPLANQVLRTIRSVFRRDTLVKAYNEADGEVGAFQDWAKETVDSLNQRLQELSGNRALREDDLDPTDYDVLRLLHSRKSQLTTDQIAQRLSRAKGSIGKNLSRLKKRGFLHNEPRKGYSITASGREAFSRAREVGP